MQRLLNRKRLGIFLGRVQFVWNERLRKGMRVGLSGARLVMICRQCLDTKISTERFQTEVQREKIYCSTVPSCLV